MNKQNILIIHLLKFSLSTIVLFFFIGCTLFSPKSEESERQKSQGEKGNPIAEYQSGENQLTLSIYPEKPWKAGVPLKLLVETISSEDSTVFIPDLSKLFESDSSGNFKIVSNGKQTDNTSFLMSLRGIKKTTQTFTLYTTLPETYVLQGFTVEIDGIPLFTEEIQFPVESSLIENQEMYDVSPPLEGTGLYTWQIILLIIIGIVLILAVFFYKKIITFIKRIFSPRFNALKAAKKEISKLTGNNLSNNKTRKDLYFTLSTVLRSYIDAVLPYGWSGKTTDELLPELEERDEIYPASIDEIRDFLLRSEEIKFAGMDVTIEQAKKDLTFCEEWIELEAIHLKNTKGHKIKFKNEKKEEDQPDEI